PIEPSTMRMLRSARPMDRPNPQRYTTMKTTTIRILSLCLLCLGASVAQAHHSFAMFDQSKKVTHTGKISDIQWTNPHVWIFVDVPMDDGTLERWGMELTSKVHLKRRGFDPDDFAVGDEVEFTVSPYANGKPGGRFYTIRDARGLYHCDVGAAQQVCKDNNPQ